MTLLIATRNPNKRAELADMFGCVNLTLLDMSAYPWVPDMVEDADTFEGNAAMKAVETARLTGLWTLADDSGLEVDALGGAPGIHSARYAGVQGDHPANNRKLIEALATASCRSARFRTILALASPWGSVRFAEGVCEGTIVREPRGRNGFGYDPLFVPEGHSRTFAEMESRDKNALSHRARAVAAARDAWSSLLGIEG